MQDIIGTEHDSSRDIDTLKQIVSPNLARVMNEYIESELEKVKQSEIPLSNPLVEVLYLIVTLRPKIDFSYILNKITHLYFEGFDFENEIRSCIYLGDQYDSETIAFWAHSISCFLEDEPMQQQYKEDAGLTEEEMEIVIRHLNSWQRALLEDDGTKMSEQDYEELTVKLTNKQGPILLEYIIRSVQRDAYQRLRNLNQSLSLEKLNCSYEVAKRLVEKYLDKYTLWASTLNNIYDNAAMLYSRMVTPTSDLEQDYQGILAPFMGYYVLDNKGKALFQMFEQEYCCTPVIIAQVINILKNSPYRTQFCEYYKKYCDRQQKKPCFDIDSLLNPILYIDYQRAAEDDKYYVRLLDEKVSKDSLPNYEAMYTALSTLYGLLEEKQYLKITDNRALFIFRLSGLFELQDSVIDDFRNTDKIIWYATPTELALLIYYLYTPKGAQGERPKYKKIGDFFVKRDGGEFKDLPRLANSALNSKKDEKNKSVVKILKAAGFNIE